MSEFMRKLMFGSRPRSLVDAAKANDVKEVRLLVNQGRNINETDDVND